MNWTKFLYVAILMLLYIPMVFLGANVLFPKYLDSDSYYSGPYPPCYVPYSTVTPNMTDAERTAAEKRIYDQQMECQKKYDDAQTQWKEDKRLYEGMKYTAIALFNLAILLFALYFSPLEDSVVLGLFLGSTVSTFASTSTYFQSRSLSGFFVLLVTFFVVIAFINKKKDTFFHWHLHVPTEKKGVAVKKEG
jgi:hypothetical protein